MHQKVFCKKGVCKNLAKFAGKRLCRNHFSKKFAGLTRYSDTDVFLSGFKIFKYTFFIKQPKWLFLFFLSSFLIFIASVCFRSTIPRRILLQ